MINKTISLAVTGSTHTLAKEMAAAGAEGGVLITARTQTAGRGQFERKWDSRDGGLYFTLILRPSKDISQIGALTVKTAEAVCDALKKMYGIKSKIKRPNDVLAYAPAKKQYLKICGILTETASTQNAPDWVVLSAGINLNNGIDSKIPAVSVKKITGRPADAEEFKKEFFKLLSERYEQWLLSARGGEV